MEHNDYQTMTLFNFFPKQTASKYKLNNMKKENKFNDKHNNNITQKIKSKDYNIKLSKTKHFSCENIKKEAITSRITQNINKNNYIAIHSRLNLYKTSTNFFKDLNPPKNNVNGNIEKENIETEKKINFNKNEYSIERRKSKSNKYFILDRLFYKSRKNLKNSLNEVNKENVTKKNNYLTDENNTKIYKMCNNKNVNNTKKSSVKFRQKENNNIKYYNNQLPLLNKINTSRKNLNLQGFSNELLNSEKARKKKIIFKNNYIQNNSNKENNNENIKEDNKQNVNNELKPNNLISSYKNIETKNEYYNNKPMISINSDFGNNNIIFTQSNRKIFKNSFYNSQNNKIKPISSSNNIIGKNKNKNRKNELKQENSQKNINFLVNFTHTNFNFFANNKKKSVEKNELHEVKYSSNAKKGFLKYENNLMTYEKDLFSNKYNNTIKTTILSKNKIKQLEKYNIGNILGKGAYALVKLITDKITNEKYAMKIYEKAKLNDSLKKKCVYKEIEILKRVKHKNIVKLIEVIHSEKQILIIQEYIKGISLRDYYNKEIKNQKGISEHKTKIFKKIFRQIFDAMNYLHCNHMAHRDIKLENILLTKEYEIKIIDFGFGMLNPENKIQYFFCGTPNYMPPEIIEKKGYNGQKADLWSLGILLYKIYCANFPFKGKNEKELYQSIKKNQYTIMYYVPENVKKIIKGLIEYEPNRRMSCKEILKSEWLQN